MKVIRLSCMALLLTCAMQASGRFSVTRSISLSNSGDAITIQQPASGSNIVSMEGAYVDCVGCSSPLTVTVEVNGAAATTTTVTPAVIPPSKTAAAAKAFVASNVGGGTVISRASDYSKLVFDLKSIKFPNDGTGNNVTIRVSNNTGNLNVVITWTEEQR